MTFVTGISVRVAGVRISGRDSFPSGQIRTVLREEGALISSAALSLKEAGLGEKEAMDASVILGVDGAIDELKEGFFKGVLRDGPLGASPVVFPYTSPNALAARVTVELGMRGRAVTFASGALSFLKAVSHAYALISSGEAGYAVAGGVTKGGVVTMVMGGGGEGLALTGAAEGRAGAGKIYAASMRETFSAFAEALKEAGDKGESHLSVSGVWGDEVRLSFSMNG